MVLELRMCSRCGTSMYVERVLTDAPTEFVLCKRCNEVITPEERRGEAAQTGMEFLRELKEGKSDR